MAAEAFDHEAMLLGALMAHPDQAALVWSRLRPTDLDPPTARPMAEAMYSLRVSGQPPEPVRVVDEMRRRGTLSQAGGEAEVHRIAGHGFADLQYALEALTERARLRTLWVVTTRARGMLEAPDARAAVIAKQTVDQVQAVLDGADADVDVPTLLLREFLGFEDPEFEWVLPGLLERGDRVVLTGPEGMGKSVLLRQIAVCAAAGVHPFNRQQQAPVRTLLVDCENSRAKMVRDLRPLALNAGRLGSDPRDSMWVESVPAGLDLAVADDERWLVRMVSSLQPELLVIGPVYRLHAANPNDEATARTVTRVLDRCRLAANCALVVEAHAGHGASGSREMRPTGSSLWLRWPEFGYGMTGDNEFDAWTRSVSIKPWRGDRDERQWPTQLIGGGVLPWQEP